MAKKTTIYDFHVSHSALMCDFAGFSLPIRYQSEQDEYLACRQNAGLFDTSHMGQLEISGENAACFLEEVLSNNIGILRAFQAQYSLLLNDKGGIIDDLIVYCFDKKRFWLCVNAANIHKDFTWLKNKAASYSHLTLKNLSADYSMMALQGPKTFLILETMGYRCELPKFTFEMHEFFPKAECLVARTGYTGEENGVEIYVKNSHALSLWKAIMKAGKALGIKACGLASRDVLRIEAGLLLYGKDMDESTTPKEAGLMFAIDAKTNDFLVHGGFCTRKRLQGFFLKNPGIPRGSFKVLDDNKKELGVVTSGTFLPERKLGCGFAYLDKKLPNGAKIYVEIRNRPVEAQICQRNFLKNRTITAS